jgi:hypothetical protein
MVLHCKAQTIDTANFIFSNEWRFSKKKSRPYLDRHNFIELDTIQLYLSEKFDFTLYKNNKNYFIHESKSGTRSIIDKVNGYTIFVDLKDGEKIRFDDNLKIHYYHGLACTVGESLFEFADFKLINGKVFIAINQKPWNEKDNIKKFEFWYDIITISKDYIVLKKIIESK